ncbi:MAG: MotA/TolQ/ExbB proton channel family protein, partial [Abditibacteriales bacterium]|nr:MotA/TolQ/ExbB proton channel family protein [Abditibacteriales bacterium]
MELATVIGLVIGLGSIFLALMLEGGNLASLINLPAFVIVIGGTLGATTICVSLPTMTGLIGVTMKAFFAKPHDPRHTIEELVGLAERARREGLLVLEEQARNTEDPFLKKGIQLAVDGVDPQTLRTILETEIQHMVERHHIGASVYDTMGGFAPTMGIIGTVMGLVHMLENLSEPGKMGHAIAAAFIATLYGVISANIIFLPLGSKLKAISA